MNSTLPSSVPPSTTNAEPQLAIIYKCDLPSDTNSDSDSDHATESISLGYEASDALRKDAIGKGRYYMPTAIADLHSNLELPSAVALIAADSLLSDPTNLRGREATLAIRKTAVLDAIARGLQAMSGSDTPLDIKDLSTASDPKSSKMYASIPAYHNPGDTAGPYTNSGGSRSDYPWGRSSRPLKTLVGDTIDCLRKGVLPTDGTSPADATGDTTMTMAMTEEQKTAVEKYQTTFDELYSTPGRRNGLMPGRDDVLYQTVLPIVLASASASAGSTSVPDELIRRLDTELVHSKEKREADKEARGARPRPGGPNGAGVKSI